MPRDGTYADASGLLRLLFAASLVVPAALSAIVAWTDYRTAYRDSMSDLARTAEVAREQAVRIFDIQRLVAERVRDMLDDLDTAVIVRTEAALHQRLVGMIADLPLVPSLAAIDAEGHPLVATDVFPVPRATDYADRDYFKALRDSDNPVYLSGVQMGRIHPAPFFGIGVRRSGPDGKFMGVINVAVSPAFFTNVYAPLVGRTASGAEGEVITLIRADGQILVRYPSFPGTPPKCRGPTPSSTPSMRIRGVGPTLIPR